MIFVMMIIRSCGGGCGRKFQEQRLCLSNPEFTVTFSVDTVMKAILLTTALAFQFVSAQGIPEGQFVEEDQPFLRSALIVSEKPLNRVRRGILIPLGRGYWTCFDPDLLRYAAIWKAPPGKAPLSLDSMAGISYPDKKAKADKPPMLQGKIVSQTAELPGVGIGTLPEKDIREISLTEGEGKVGPLPVETGRFLGLTQTEGGLVLSYKIGKRTVSESNKISLSGIIERSIVVSAGKESLAIGLDGSAGKVSGTGASQGVILDHGEFQHLFITGQNSFEIRTTGTSGTSLIVRAASEASSFNVIRSVDANLEPPRFEGLMKSGVGEPAFPEKIEVTSKPASDNVSPISERPLNLPLANPWKRAVRPTDIAFLSNGDALITTLDGDVWRVENIAEEKATWSRAACGIFEPMSIAISKKDEVFVLGRDQITRLIDSNNDGFFDIYACASDAFPQTIHTRDYSTSLELEDDGSFVIARSGLTDNKKSIFGETVPGRGSVLRISPNGLIVVTVADGLRVPFIGKRADGALFVSDQQGNFIPSTPIHLLGNDTPYLGYEPADFRSKKTPKPPLLWFPYQINRSGSSFATLAEKAFPSLGNAFVHLSWSGRIFPVETPKTGLPFAWKLPFDFDFPILGAATHPQNGKLYATGIGISGYLPQTPNEVGLAEISERVAMVAPVSFSLESGMLIVAFNDSLPPAISLIAPRPELDLWNIKRTPQYGSGHFRWDGEPGEHSITTGAVTVSPDRTKVAIAVPEIFKSDILRLRLHIRDTSVKGEPYTIEIYARPESLPEAGKADLAAVAEREKKSAVKLVPGETRVGKALFTNYGCTGCHSLDGTKLTGPPLNGIATRHAADLDSYLKTSILEPAAVIAEGYEPSMPSFAGVIPEQDIAHLVAYLRELK